MASIVIKIVDGTKPEQVALAMGELEGAGFHVTYHKDADILGVDATKHGGCEDAYGASVVIIGEK